MRVTTGMKASTTRLKDESMAKERLARFTDEMDEREQGTDLLLDTVCTWIEEAP